MSSQPAEVQYMGVDLNAPRGSFGYTLIGRNQRILSRGCMKLEKWDAFLQSQSVQIICLTSPVSLNTGQMRRPDFRQSLNPVPPGSRYQNLRTSEYEILSRGLPVSRTPADFDACSPSVQRSLRFTSALAVCGYNSAADGENGRQLLEIPPEAWFQQLLGYKLLPASSLEGRIQRQLVLQSLNLNVPDAMEFFEEVTRHKLLFGQLPENIVLPLPVLYSIAAAYTAWASVHAPGLICCFGCSDEGYLHLPIPKKAP